MCSNVIALVENSQVALGVIYNFVSDEFFHAIRQPKESGFCCHNRASGKCAADKKYSISPGESTTADGAPFEYLTYVDSRVRINE